MVAVVTFSDSWLVPVPVDLNTVLLLGNLPCFPVGNVAGLLPELFNITALLLDSLCSSVNVKNQASVFRPLIFDSLKGRSRLAFSLSASHDSDQVFAVFVDGTKNEGVVSLVDVGSDQSSSFRVGTADDDVLDAHNVVLETNGYKSVDVLRNWYEHLSGCVKVLSAIASSSKREHTHVSTLLGCRRLVFNVNTSCSALDKELGEFHDSSQTTVTTFCIRCSSSALQEHSPSVSIG